MNVLAVDIGNSAAKFGGRVTARIPHAELSHLDQVFEQLPAEVVEWRIASVHRNAASQMEQTITANRPKDLVRHMAPADLDLQVKLANPAGVGIDRLCAAAATGQKEPNGAIIVDAGTAITIDLLKPPNQFWGGTILPGLPLQLASLSSGTDGLPSVELQQVPPLVGKDTTAAIQSGVFWGAVGAVKEIVARMKNEHSVGGVFVTGGDGPKIAEHLKGEVTLVPHLVLEGILAAQ